MNVLTRIIRAIFKESPVVVTLNGSSATTTSVVNAYQISLTWP